VRAGFITRVGAGIYNYLPLAWRTLTRISDIVREEMNAAGGSEMLMPALEPIELMQRTGREADYGDNLFRVTDRHGRVVALAPTHEEIITDMLSGVVSSHRQLPLILYQIQTKFRDEFRPCSGLLRCREFIMKDAYSFHVAVDGPGGLGEAYDAMHRAYSNIFTRCGLDYSVVEAEAGPIGGSASHEFMVNCNAGEDVILKCPASGYAANVEKCEIGDRLHSFDGEPTGALVKVHTPGAKTIEDVCKVLKVKPKHMLKCVLFKRMGDDAAVAIPPSPSGRGAGEEDASILSSPLSPRERAGGEGSCGGAAFQAVQSPQPRFILAVVRGDHEANEGKVKAVAGGPVALADEADAKAAGFAVGFISPRSAIAVPGVTLVVDPDAAQGKDKAKGKPMFWAAGADEVDHHVKHFNWRRELAEMLDDESRVVVADIRNARAGDPSPRAKDALLEEGRGIEVGHIFQLGDKYSKAMGFSVLDEAQHRKSVIMGCYGVGVSRTMAACVEMSHDDDGIVWPAPIAPFDILITPMKVDPQSEIMQTAAKVAAELAAAGFDVLIDDRDERPGVKFKDADLIGAPIRLTLGDKALAQGCVEFKRRNEPGKGEMVNMGNVVQKCKLQQLS